MTLMINSLLLEKGFSWILIFMGWNLPFIYFRLLHQSAINKLIIAKSCNLNFISEDNKIGSAIELAIFLKEHEAIFSILFVIVNVLFILQALKIGKKFCYLGYVLILVFVLYGTYFLQFHLLNKLLG